MPRLMQELHGFPVMKCRRGNNPRRYLKTNETLIGIWELRMADKSRKEYLKQKRKRQVAVN